MLYLFDEFELSDEGFSLSRSGRRIPMEPRALCVLLVLVEHAGKLLDKKFLLEAVWKDTFVEETTLTRAIAVIRKHIGDDPREPRYIETVPTRGYRFIAPVTAGMGADAAVEVYPLQEIHAATMEPAALPLKSEAIDTPSVAMPTAAWQDDAARTHASAPSSTETVSPARRGGKAWLWLSGIAAAVVIAVLGAWLLTARRAAKGALSPRDLLVLADFTNTTGDAAFDVALRQGLLVQLEQSPVLRLASDGQIRKTLKRMGLHEDDAVTAQVGREVCQRLGGSVVLDGSITRLGSTFVIGLRARRCSSGEELDAEQVQIARKEDALHALSKIATRFRGRIGEASATVHEFDTPLAEATTPSLEALSAFTHGMRAFNAKGSSAAIPLFRYATELDPEFAGAHAWLGRMYADIGDEAGAVQSTQRAYALRSRTGDRERFTIEVSYDLLVTGNLEKARSACDAWIQMYPHDVYPRGFLSATIYPAYGQHERALNEAKQIIALDPDFVLGYRNAAMNLIALDRVDEAKQVLEQAAQRKVFLPSFITDAYRIAFLKDDSKGMEQALSAAPRNPWLLFFHAATLARLGQLRQSQVLQARALEIARQSDRKNTEVELLVDGAYTDLFYGYPEKAAQEVLAALKLPAGRYGKGSAALVLAMAGHSGEAEAVAEDLRKQFPEDTVLQYNFLPTVQAAIALAQTKPQQALQLLEPTAQFGLSLPLYPVYLRGEAHLALGQSAQAVTEFASIVNHPGLVMNDPLRCVAQLHLAEAYARSGREKEARAAIETVRQQWSGADDFPLRKQLLLQMQTP